MELTSAHLRYLLAIYEVSQTHLDISSPQHCRKAWGDQALGGAYHESAHGARHDRKGALRQDLYDRPGHLGGKTGDRELKTILTHFPPVGEPLSEEERFTAALAMTSALPERIFTGEYERLFGSDAEKTETEKAQ